MDGVVRGGTGKHVGSISLEEGELSLRAWYICEVMYSPITVLVRTSICLSLLRIATRPLYRWIIYVNLIVVWIISLVFCFIMVFQCSPISHFWEQLEGKPGQCINPNIVPDATVAHSCVSAVSDWIIGLLPIALLWNVQLNRRTKATVAILLSMGML